MRGLRRLPAIAMSVGCALTVAMAQQTVYVDDATCPGVGNGTPGNPYCKIQDAICAIKDSAAGGTVMVQPGTYAEAIRMFKNVSVVSTGGAAVTTINANGKACITQTCTVSTTTPCAVVYFPSIASGGGATNADSLDGFTLTGGKGIRQTCSGTCNAQAGGGVFVLNASPTITRNVITGNSLNPSLTGSDLVFRGGGIYVGSSPGSPSRPVITLNTIDNNIADPPAGTSSKPNFGIGAGIYADLNSAPTIEDNTIRNNRSGLASKANQFGGGGGLSIYTDQAIVPGTVIRGNTISNNLATDWGGGLALSFLYAGGPTGKARVEANLIEQNTADEGGGMYLAKNSSQILDNTVTDNTALGGAGVSFESGSTGAKLADNLITFNTATNTGGGIYIGIGLGLNPTIKKNDLHANTPNNVGGDKNDAQVIGTNGNVNVNPLYISRVAGSRNLRLQAASPVIDQGDNADIVATTDRDGAPRIQDGAGDPTAIVDMGAYEFSPDFDTDGTPDWQDADDDNDGVPDVSDCAPRDATAWALPVELAGMHASGTAPTQISWTTQGAGFRYDVVGGTIATLRANGNVSGATCLANDLTGASWNDPQSAPGPGAGYYYLGRAQNACGGGGYGLGTPPRVPSADCP